MTTSSVIGRRRTVAFMALLVAVVAVVNAKREAWNDLAYYDWLRRAQRGEIVIRGASGIVLVQGPKVGTWSSGTSFTVVLTSSPTNGNMLVIAIGTWTTGTSPTVSSITQTGATWSKAKAQSNTNSDAEVWYTTALSGAGTTITINLSGTPAIAGAAASEYSGLDPSPLDKTTSATGSSVSPASGTTATTTVANELLIASITGTNGAISSPTNGFTLTTSTSNHGYLAKIVSSTGAYSTAVTSATCYWAGCIATFIIQQAVSINVSDSGSGVEALTSQSTFGVSDSGLFVDAVLRNFTIIGTVKDSGATPVPGATVWLFRTSDEAFIAATTSGADGSYMFLVTDTSTQYFVRAHIDSYEGSRVWGTTDRTLVAS